MPKIIKELEHLYNEKTNTYTLNGLDLGDSNLIITGLKTKGMLTFDQCNAKFIIQNKHVAESIIQDSHVVLNAINQADHEAELILQNKHRVTDTIMQDGHKGNVILQAGHEVLHEIINEYNQHKNFNKVKLGKEIYIIDREHNYVEKDTISMIGRDDFIVNNRFARRENYNNKYVFDMEDYNETWTDDKQTAIYMLEDGYLGEWKTINVNLLEFIPLTCGNCRSGITQDDVDYERESSYEPLNKTLCVECHKEEEKKFKEWKQNNK